MFYDRHEAGMQLAKALEKYRGENTVVIALPRGGVILGYEVAHELGCLLDIVAPRKIGHPSSPEYAIGAVDEHGTRILDTVEAKTIDAPWIEEESLQQQEEAQRRINLYRNGRDKVELKGKTVIIVDDGIATGLTMRLAVRSIKKQKPEKIIVAVPVAPADSERLLRDEGADEVIVLEPPSEFLGAVGAHYAAFPQVTDQEVIELLDRIAVQ